ncbi:MAG: hypothetical protein KJO07_00155, partial [Deltaproteobacteria bacterium]|nr:hypothetical protein [Deltaproteobacteria bacterium]
MRRINLSTSLLAGLAAITMAGPASAQSTLHSTIEEYKILGGDGSHWVRGTTVENHSVKYGGGEIDRYLNPNDPRFGRDRPEENAQTNVEHPAIIQIEAGPHAGKLVLCALGSANGTPTDVDGDGIYERDGLQDLEDANYVVTTYDRTQLYGAVLTITPTGVVMEKGVYLTDSDGNRYRNAHKCRMSLVNGGRDVLMQHNYAPNNDDNNNGLTCQANHACAYSTVYDGNLVPKSDPRIEEGAIGTLTVAKNNDNCSENDGPAAVAYDTCDCDPETDPDCDPSGTCVTASVQGDGCNGNGRDDSWLTQVRVTCDNSVTEGYPCTIQNYADLSACEDHERWRGQCEKDEGLSSEMGVPVVMCCGTAGNTQPPNKGVRCQGMVVVDTDGMQQVNRNGNRGFDAVYDPLNPAAGGLQLYDDSDYEYNGLYVAENYRDEEGKRVYNTEIKCDPTSAGQFM